MRLALVPVFFLFFTGIAVSQNTERQSPGELGGMIGQGAAGITFASGWVYADLVYVYSSPILAKNQPWFIDDNDPDYKAIRTAIGIGLAAHIPVVWELKFLAGGEMYVHKSSYSLYGMEIKGDAKYKVKFHLFGGMEYHFPSWSLGVGYGDGRGINVSAAWVIPPR